MQIEFEIKEQELIRLDKKNVASYIDNHLKCLFLFDENWTNLEKYAIFEDVSKNKYLVYLGFGQNLACFTPQEATIGNYFRVSVFANELMTSTQETVLIQPSGYDFSIEEIDLDDSMQNQVFEDELSYRKNYDDDWQTIPRCKQFIRDEHPQE